MSRKARIRNRVILFIFLIIAIIMGLYSLVMNRSKGIMVKHLEDYFGQKANISSLNIMPPLRFEIEGVKVGDLFSIKKIIISPSIIGMLLGRIAFNDVVFLEPELVLNRNSQGKVEIYPGAANQETVSVPPATAETPKAQEIKSKAPKRLFIIKHLRIKEGKFAFVDYNISEHGYKVVIEDINLAASRVSFSILPAKTHFAGKAKIFASDQNKATVALKGWINLFKKDLDAKLNLTNLDLGIFSPYLSSKDNPQIKGGILNAEADLKAKNNKLTATASLNLKGFLYKEPTEKETSSASVLQPMLFGMLETSDGHPQKFTIEGKLLPFTVEKVNFDVFIAKDKLKDVFSSAPEGIQDASKIFEEKPKEATPEVAPPIGEAAPEVNAEIPAANAEIPQPPDANVETPTVVQ